MFIEAVVLLILYYLVDNFYLKRRNLPPGPIPLPFIGNFLSLKNNRFEPQIKEWHKIYGNIMTVWLGNKAVVTLHDSPQIYETFLKDGESYTGRPENKGFDTFRGGKYGIIFTDGSQWREHRRFALHVLRNFGLGKNLMQERVLVEVTELISDVNDILKTGVNEVSLVDEIDRSVGSIINALAFGYRFGHDKRDEFFENKNNIQEMITKSSSTTFRMMSPYVHVLKHFPVFKTAFQDAKRSSDKIRSFYMKNIDEHRKRINFEANEEPTDYVEAFLRQQYAHNKAGNKEHTFTDEQLYGTIFDLWLAGQETTSTTLAWVFLYMIKNPECQKKVHQELDKVVGSDRIVTLDDKSALNYLCAVVNESQRMCNLLAFNVLHQTTKKVEIEGYEFPVGTIITNQICTVLSDERYFKNPDVFDPERFLDANGKFCDRPEMMQFGIGKRACLGEGLARMELFLFTANILNQFELKPVGGVLPDDTRIMRGTTVCKPYKCLLKQRQ